MLESDGVPSERYGVGDVILFPAGTRAKWHVEDYVKKVAFCRLKNPLPFAFAIRVANKLKSLITSTPHHGLLEGPTNSWRSETQNREVAREISLSTRRRARRSAVKSLSAASMLTPVLSINPTRTRFTYQSPPHSRHAG